jgi:hypothetical protein
MSWRNDSVFYMRHLFYVSRNNKHIIACEYIYKIIWAESSISYFIQSHFLMREAEFMIMDKKI